MTLLRARIHRLAARTALPVATAVGVAGLAGSCTDRPEPDPAPRPAGVVRIAVGQPGDLLPSAVDGPDGAQVLAALYTPLVGFDQAGEPVPVAAESVEPSDGGRVWTVTLRDGFTFHDGEPVTARNYLDAWNYAAYQPNRQHTNYQFRRIAGYDQLNPPGDRRPAARTLSGLAAVDERTFTITLSEPFGDLPAMLGGPAFYPLPAAAFTSRGALQERFADAPIGNGPFRIAGERRPGEPIAVERYPDYAGEPAQVDRVEFVVYQPPDDPYPDLLAGELDVVAPIPAGHLATVGSDLGERYLRRPASGFQFLAVPTYQERFANPAIRRAISMAIDREEIATGIFRGTRAPAQAFVPAGVPGARAGTCGPTCQFDPANARALYQQAGGPEQLTITYNTDGGHQTWVETVCEQLREHLGVGCVAAAEPTLPDVLARLEQREDVGMVRMGWTPDHPSMAGYLEPVFASDGAANLWGHHDPELDAQLDAAAGAGSRAEAVAAYQRAEEMLAEDLPVIPLWFAELTIGHSPRVHGVAVTPFDLLDLTQLSIAPLSPADQGLADASGQWRKWRVPVR